MMKPTRIAMAMAAILLLSSAALADLGQEIATRTLPHLVTIHTFSRQAEETGIGSGFWIGGGEVATNAHVIAGAAWAEIHEMDGTLVGAAPYAVLLDASNDLAVLAVPAGHQQGLAVASEDPGVGAAVWAFGAPLGLEGTVSAGNISAIREGESRRVLQMTVPISPGSSGGPIVNADGLVVGITVGMLTEGQNLNFAVPASALRALLSRTRGRLVFPAPGTVGAMLEKPDAGGGPSPEASARFLAIIEGLAAADSVTYGQAYPGRLEDGDLDIEGRTDIYKFFGEAGQSIEITATSKDFDIMVEVMDARSLLTDEEDWGVGDDDGGGGTNAHIQTVLPETGVYHVTIRAVDNGRGEYTLWLGTAPSADRWVHLGSDNEMDVLWDSRTMVRNGSTVTGWVRFAYKQLTTDTAGKAYDTMTQKVECDCSGRRFRIMASQWSNKGGVVGSANPDTWVLDWQNCAPDTWAESILEAACAQR